jgi:Mg-chelatase subunit ChlD
MLRRLITLSFFALVALVAVVAALGANPQPRVTEATGTGFPARSYILTLPHGMKLKNGAVHVSENGRPVADLTVTPVGESTSRQFGAVLVVDASTSMEGKPERAAFSAARAFAAQRKGQEQLALVTYNIEPTVVLPFATEQAKIDAALSKQPPFLFGTHIYDAITHSLDML